MKDFMKYDKPYEVEEWEKDKDWLAKRQAFLWALREYNYNIYHNNNLSEELNDLYMHYDLYTLAHHVDTIEIENYLSSTIERR